MYISRRMDDEVIYDLFGSKRIGEEEMLFSLTLEQLDGWLYK